MKKLFLVTILILSSSNSFSQWSDEPSDQILIRGGWLFDGISDSRRKNKGILIEKGKIIYVDRSLEKDIASTIKIIELSDSETILPGMIDLHAHYNFDFIDQGRVEEVVNNGIIFLANGVTSTWSAGESDPEEMGDDSFESVMALIESQPTQTTQISLRVPSDVPSALSDYIGGSLQDIKWRPIGLGVKQSLLKTSGNSTARLLYIPAGTAVPHHSHNGNELTLVLKGAFEDEVARFGPGDVEMADEDLDHQPIAVEGEDCICLAVTDAPLKFQTFVHKLVQPFLKI